ncbi:DUF4258 domain-containing protein [Fibrobacter sp. UWH4]|uniref:DUF4258 domain-containing protein n=1 Tax=Fibrobacter sp. UWH4 TaxID=1896210 RepID=UPI0009213018|nr:protein of unknown function [Fibrobacter sp. UWH4]
MNIKISEHAKQRMDERGVSEEQVRNFFDSNEPISYWKISDFDNSVILVDTVFDGCKFRLVYNALTDTLITLFPRR